MAQIEMVFAEIESVEPNKFSTNLMSLEAYEALKAEMKKLGNLSFWDEPHAAIVVSSYVNFYGKPSPNELTRFVIVDGYHRWKAAKELGWTEIAVEVTAQNEDKAQQYSYKVNKNRGTLDPLKEAQLFNSESRSGGGQKTQQEIADKYGVDRSYVAKTLGLLQLPEKLIGLLDPDKNIEKGIHHDGGFVPKDQLQPLTRSHLEALEGLPKREALEIAVVASARGHSVATIEERVKTAKDRIREQAEEERVLSSFTMRTCPICGKDGNLDVKDKEMTCWDSVHYNLTYSSLSWGPLDTKESVLARKIHVNGKETTLDELMKAKSGSNRPAVPPKRPDWFKYEKAHEEMRPLLGNFLMKLIRAGELIDEALFIEIRGLKDGKPVEIELGGTYSGSMPIFNISTGLEKWDGEDQYKGGPHIPWGDKSDKINFSLENGEWKKGNWKTRVRVSDAKKPEELQCIQIFLDKVARGEANLKDIPWNLKKPKEETQ